MDDHEQQDWEQYIRDGDSLHEHSFDDNTDALCPVVKLGRVTSPGNLVPTLSTMTYRFNLEGTCLTYGEWCEFAKIKFPGWVVLAVIEEQDYEHWKTAAEHDKLIEDDPWRTG